MPNARIEMQKTEVDLLKTSEQFGKFLKKSLNSSLFTRSSFYELGLNGEKVLDTVLGDYDTLRDTFATTLQKHVEHDG